MLKLNSSTAVKHILGLVKFRDKDVNWRGHVVRVEENILKVSVSYSMQEEETESWKVNVEREQEWVEWTVACKRKD